MIKNNSLKQNTFSLDSFKEMVSTNKDFKNNITNRTDVVDLDNGVMKIYSENLNTYLERYGCKDAEDLEDTLYYNYGIYCKVI